MFRKGMTSLKAILHFIVENYPILIMLAGMYIMTVFDAFLKRDKLTVLRAAIVMIFALVVCERIELYFAGLKEPTFRRQLFSAVCYTLRPSIIMMLIFIINTKISKVVLVPAVINTLTSFSVFFTDIAYTFDEKNHFVRGPLGLMPYIVTVMYIVFLFFVGFRVIARRNFEDGIVLLFLSAAAALASIIAAYGYDEVVNLTYTAEVLLYYLYIYQQSTRCDALTGLYNRHSFYSYTEKHSGEIMGVISIDMNELKWLNDTFGHQKGDEAIKAVSEIFLNADSSARAYRTGGDEFIMLCRCPRLEDMKEMVEKMRTQVAEAGYSCAFGLSYRKTLDEMLKEADDLMYKDKARLKAESAANGNTLHLRN